MPINKNEYLQEKIELFNTQTHVIIRKVSIDNCVGWSYDDTLGEIRNQSRTFFQIKGIEKVEGDRITLQQPIIIQAEIGFLGIIRKRIDGEMHYLMQYKIEPGNINSVQISPTIQATKSNFLQKHGGRKPEYLDYFLNASRYRLFYDQIQSEQSSRFFGKRNRNIIIEIDEAEDISVLPSHDWMTLQQIKQLMRHDNVVNMDTRTVLSCMQKDDEEENITYNGTKSLRYPMIMQSEIHQISQIYHYINNYKMFRDYQVRLIPLFGLTDWHMDANEFLCTKPYSFKLIFCDIEIEGREVKHWCQPLFEAIGIALFGLFICVDNGIRQFMVKCRPEIGCFDSIEIGPTVQREHVSHSASDVVEEIFIQKLESKTGIVFDTMLSEEGGRFYHEQNRNVIIEIQKGEVLLPDGYFWCDYMVLKTLVIINNTLNIQLRNLLSVLEVI